MGKQTLAFQLMKNVAEILACFILNLKSDFSCVT